MTVEFIKKHYNKPTTKLVLMFILIMIIGYTFSWIITILTDPYKFSLSEFLYRAFTITDAKNYIKIAEYGYTTIGNDKYLLVFFPMYPLMIRILHTITFIDYSLCAFIISLFSSCASVVLLYKVSRIDYKEECATHIAIAYLMYPVMSFMLTALNEGVFMMFLLATVYCIRKKKYILAGLFGYLVALTRLPGLCIGALMLAETIQYIVYAIKKGTLSLKIVIKQCIMMFMTLMGLATYLLINYALYNDFFKFFDYQSEIWYQHVSNPIKVIFEVIIKNQIIDRDLLVGYTNLIACIVILLSIIYSTIKKVRASYIFYMLVYFSVCYSASWILSGARYSIGAFVIFISLGIFLALHKYFRKIFYPLYFTIFLYVTYLCTNLIIH